jgi:hypothetical protein
MHVKGTAVKSIQDFVQTRFGDKYAEWLKSMPEASRVIMSKPVYVSDWYSAKDAAIEPTIAIGRVISMVIQLKLVGKRVGLAPNRH